MNDMIVKSVDLMGDTVMAAQDKKGNIWAGVSYLCKALGMSNKQRDNQVVKVQNDKILRKGTLKFQGGIFDPNNEAVGIRIDFIPLWLAKIQITDKMEKEHTELAKKLLNYQLKAKDILAEAFLPKQSFNTNSPLDVLELHYQAIKQVDQKVEEVDERVDDVRAELKELKDNMPITLQEESRITCAFENRFKEIAGGTKSNAYKNKGIKRSFQGYVYNEVHKEFGIRTFKALKRSEMDRAIQIIQDYVPPESVLSRIDNENAQQSFDL